MLAPVTNAASVPVSETAPVFAALGAPARLQVVARLCRDGPQTTTQLRQGADVSRQGITKHLQALQRAGLVRSGRVGRDRIWELEAERILETRACLDQISAQWDLALARLRAFVETKRD